MMVFEASLSPINLSFVIIMYPYFISLGYPWINIFYALKVSIHSGPNQAPIQAVIIHPTACSTQASVFICLRIHLYRRN